MLEAYREGGRPDGKLNFFAVGPRRKGQGIGTLLLNERGAAGKRQADLSVYRFRLHLPVLLP
jgi:GNAT superfamily N-acetyltransferase